MGCRFSILNALSRTQRILRALARWHRDAREVAAGAIGGARIHTGCIAWAVVNALVRQRVAMRSRRVVGAFSHSQSHARVCLQLAVGIRPSAAAAARHETLP